MKLILTMLWLVATANLFGQLTIGNAFYIFYGDSIGATQFCNTQTIQIPAFGNASPYPSTINVTGRPDNVSVVTVALFGFWHEFTDDVDILLEGPDGTTIVLMSDSGGSGANGIDPPGVTLVFDDAAPTPLPDNAMITAGTYYPTNYINDIDSWSSPAPAGPYSTNLSAFIGKPCNGAWKLYVTDDHGSDAGGITNGWCLYLPIAP